MENEETVERADSLEGKNVALSQGASEDPHKNAEDVEQKSRKESPREKKGPASPLPGDFLQKLEALGTMEEKLECTLKFMQEALQKTGGHHFREFWEARKLCTDFFTHNIHPSMRVRLWAQYSDICREARVLKHVLDEQSSFLSEQIEKAIEVVEKELPLFQEKGTHLPSVPEFAMCAPVIRHLERYEALHHELKYLNSFASRIAALRKELLKTDMKFKQRARLLDRLSQLGDVVFPKRKQAISEVSALFLEDTEEFIRSTSFSEMKTHALVEAREEIKRLQEIAKILTLGTDAFSKTRARLSECWDVCKNILKDRRKAEHEKREQYQKVREELVEEIKKVKEEISSGKINPVEARRVLHSISQKMREISLAYADVRLLRELLREAEELTPQAPISESKSVGRHEEKDRAIKIQAFLDRLKNAFHEEDIFAREKELQELILESSSFPMSRTEKIVVEKEFARLRGFLLETYETFPAQVTEKALEQHLAVLEELVLNGKRCIELWRRELSSSMSDFSMAMQYTDLIEEERKLIERIEKKIEELSRG